MGDKKETTLPSNYAGTVKVSVRGRDYYVHMTAPMPMMTVDDMLEGVRYNRAIIQQSQQAMNKVFEEELKYAPPWALDYDTPTQNAIQAHMNINMLIPLISLKGGITKDGKKLEELSFQKPETLNVQARLEIMRNVAEKTVFTNRINNSTNTFSIAAILTFVLILFLSLAITTS